jgi:polyisoprenoid-binding protein YceI
MRTARALRLAAIPALPAFAIAAWLGAPDGATTYRVIDSRSRVEVIVRAEGLVDNFRGLIFRARDVKGTIVHDPLHPERSRVDFRVPVKDMYLAEPRLTAEQTKMCLLYLRCSWVLDMARFEEISFLGSGVRFGEPRGSGYFSVHSPGRLEIRGRMNRTVIDGIARVTTEGIEVIGRKYVHLRDHGIQPLIDVRSSAYKLKQDVEVTFHIFAVPMVEWQLHEDEIHPSTLTPRGEHAGELEKKGEAPDMKVPEPEPVDPHSGEYTDPRYEPR